MKDDNLETLAKIFRAIFELPERADVENVSKTTMRRWDSLAQVGLIAAIENEFSITIRVADYERMNSFKSISLLLSEQDL